MLHLSLSFVSAFSVFFSWFVIMVLDPFVSFFLEWQHTFAQDGKKTNKIIADDSTEFTYHGPSGPSQSTAKVEGNRLVMSSQSEDPPV